MARVTCPRSTAQRPFTSAGRSIIHASSRAMDRLSKGLGWTSRRLPLMAASLSASERIPRWVMFTLVGIGSTGLPTSTRFSIGARRWTKRRKFSNSCKQPFSRSMRPT